MRGPFLMGARPAALPPALVGQVERVQLGELTVRAVVYACEGADSATLLCQGVPGSAIIFDTPAMAKSLERRGEMGVAVDRYSSCGTRLSGRQMLMAAQQAVYQHARVEVTGIVAYSGGVIDAHRILGDAMARRGIAYLELHNPGVFDDLGEIKAESEAEDFAYYLGEASMKTRAEKRVLWMLGLLLGHGIRKGGSHRVGGWRRKLLDTMVRSYQERLPEEAQAIQDEAVRPAIIPVMAELLAYQNQTRCDMLEVIRMTRKGWKDLWLPPTVRVYARQDDRICPPEMVGKLAEVLGAPMTVLEGAHLHLLLEGLPPLS